MSDAYHRELLEAVKRLVREMLESFRFDLTQSTGTLPPTQLPPAGGSGGGSRGAVLLSDDTPEDTTSGSGSAGTSGAASRADHVHHSAGGGGGLVDADYGDVTVGGGGTTMTIDNDVVTFAKMQNIATDRLLGRDTASSGDVEELTVGGGVEFTGSGGIQRSALTGDVTASAGSNSTTIANDAVTYAKMQNVSATDKLLGRVSSGSGDVEEVAFSDFGQSLIDDADAAAGRATLGAAPVGAKYIVQQADSELSAEQALGALATGLLKNTTTTGVLSIADATDLPSHDHTGSTDGGKLTDDVHDGYSVYEEISTPSTPAANTVRLYAKDKSGLSILYFKDDAGTEYDLSAVSTGAPLSAEYITSAANGTLSSEVVIPGLAGSADRSGIAGAGISHEFDSSSTIFTWSSAPTTEDYDTTIPSHVYIRHAATSADIFGTVSWSPAGAFDARAKLIMGSESTSASDHWFALHIQNSDNSNRVECRLFGNGMTARGYTFTSSTYTQRGSAYGVGGNEMYARISRDGSNNVSFWYSKNGLLWELIATQAFTFTVAKLGLHVSTSGAYSSTVGITCACDWLRTDV